MTTVKDTERAAMLSAIEDYLLFLERAAPRQRGMEPSARVPLSVFKDAEPLYGELAGALGGAERTLYLDEDDNPERWLPSFAVTVLCPDPDPGGRFLLNRVRTLQPAETRGRIDPWTRHAAVLYVAFVSAAGTYNASEMIYGYVGGRWCIVDGRARHRRLEPEHAAIERADGTTGHLGFIGEAHQIAVYRSLMWHVSIGYAANRASLLVPCEAQAILDLFRYRDLPAGKPRRDALLHWVSAHWRRKVSDPADSARVVAHLRGQTSFTWRDGLQVRVLPSEEDKKKVQPHHKHAADPVAPR